MHPTIRSVILLLILGIAPGLLRAQTPQATPPPPRQPAAQPAPINPKLPTIFIASDSTAAPSNGGGGWGVPFATFFDPAKVNVVNDARGGRSSRTFITDGTWDKLLADVKSGDIVLIQFGHNDVGVVNQVPPGSKEPLRARGSLPGLGEETQEIDNVVTHKHEIVHTFGWYMRKMINETRAKGAMPIVLSLTVRNNWKDGKVERGLGEYRKWAEEIAEHEGVAFVDLTSILADEYDKMGEAAVKRFFPRDNTHANAEGSEFCAASIVAGFKALKDDPLAPYLSAKAAEVTPYAP